MKAKKILAFVPGVNVFYFIAAQQKDSRELAKAQEDYKSNLRQHYIAEIKTFEAQKRHQDEARVADLEKKIYTLRELYKETIFTD
jgi:hypothetical protein